MNTLIKKITAILVLGLSLIMFQNCGASFDINNDEPMSLELVEIEDGEVEGGMNPVTALNPGQSKKSVVSNPSISKNQSSNNSNERNPASLENKNKKDPANADKSNREKKATNIASNESERLFICILENNGRSTKLGVKGAHSKTPSSLCMTELSCLDIVGSYVKVKEAKYAVQCEKSRAHIIHINEDELIDLLDPSIASK